MTAGHFLDAHVWFRSTTQIPLHDLPESCPSDRTFSQEKQAKSNTGSIHSHRNIPPPQTWLLERRGSTSYTSKIQMNSPDTILRWLQFVTYHFGEKSSLPCWYRISCYGTIQDVKRDIQCVCKFISAILAAELWFLVSQYACTTKSWIFTSWVIFDSETLRPPFIRCLTLKHRSLFFSASIQPRWAIKPCFLSQSTRTARSIMKSLFCGLTAYRIYTALHAELSRRTCHFGFFLQNQRNNDHLLIHQNLVEMFVHRSYRYSFAEGVIE